MNPPPILMSAGYSGVHVNRLDCKRPPDKPTKNADDTRCDGDTMSLETSIVDVSVSPWPSTTVLESVAPSGGMTLWSAPM